jgi:hypothetical protein
VRVNDETVPGKVADGAVLHHNLRYLCQSSVWSVRMDFEKLDIRQESEKR